MSCHGLSCAGAGEVIACFVSKLGCTLKIDCFASRKGGHLICRRHRTWSASGVFHAPAQEWGDVLLPTQDYPFNPLSGHFAYSSHHKWISLGSLVLVRASPQDYDALPLLLVHRPYTVAMPVNDEDLVLLLATLVVVVVTQSVETGCSRLQYSTTTTHGLLII